MIKKIQKTLLIKLKIEQRQPQIMTGTTHSRIWDRQEPHTLEYGIARVELRLLITPDPLVSSKFYFYFLTQSYITNGVP
jgi:hypothetical protein